MDKATQTNQAQLGGTVLSQQIAIRLLKEMQGGVFKGCSRLPAEVDLASQLGVSRTVIRDALSELEREGYVERVRGIGTVVNARIVALSNRLDQKFEYSAMIRAAGHESHADRVSIQQIFADSHLSQMLDIPNGDPVLVIRKRVFADDIPVIYSVDYLPMALFPADSAHQLDFAQPIFDLLSEVSGLTVHSTITHVNAVLGDQNVRQILQVPSHEALLLMEEQSFCRLAKPVMYSLSYYTNFFDFTILRKKF